MPYIAIKAYSKDKLTSGYSGSNPIIKKYASTKQIVEAYFLSFYALDDTKIIYTPSKIFIPQGWNLSPRDILTIKVITFITIIKIIKTLTKVITL